MRDNPSQRSLSSQGVSPPPQTPATAPPNTLAPPTVDDSSLLAAPPVGVMPLPRVPGYEVLELIGHGGMGVVYRARQTRLGRLVALKMIRDGLLANAEQVARFQVEARAVARLQHAHVVQIYEIGDLSGRPYFSLELIEGGNLAQRLAVLPLPPAEAAALVETLARAMHHAHQQGIVHRDLKPANVLLAADGTPKITDFGLAKELEASVFLTHTSSHALMGTPSYMAPEQAWGRQSDVGPAADVYALGAILYECLTGRPPFVAPKLMDVLDQVRTSDPTPPSRVRPGVPRDLETVCLKCLEKDPNRRYATAEALADDLRRYRGGETVRARRAGSAERALKWARRRPAVAALAGVLAANVAVGALLWFLPAAQPPTADPEQQYASRISNAARFLAIGENASAVEELAACRPEWRGWEWEHLSAGAQSWVVGRHTAPVIALAFDAQTGRLDSIDARGLLLQRPPDASGVFRQSVSGMLTSADFSADGKHLAVASLREQRMEKLKAFPKPKVRRQIEWNLDGALVLASSIEKGGKDSQPLPTSQPPAGVQPPVAVQPVPFSAGFELKLHSPP